MSRSETHPALPLVFGFRSAGSVVRSPEQRRVGEGRLDAFELGLELTAFHARVGDPRDVERALHLGDGRSRLRGRHGSRLVVSRRCAPEIRPVPRSLRGSVVSRRRPPPARISPTIKTSSSDPDIAKPSFVRRETPAPLPPSVGGTREKFPIPPLRPEPLFADISRIFSATIFVGRGPKLTAPFTPE